MQIKATTMEEAIKAESASIASIAILKKDTAIAVMTLLIGELILYFNVGKTMGVPQIKLTIDMLLNDLVTKNLKPEDYKVMFDDMKKGYYGNLYDRFDGQIIFKIANEYADKRASFIENESMRLAGIHKEKSHEVPTELLNVFSEVKKNLSVQTATERKQKEKLIPYNAEVTKIFSEFDKIWKEKPVNTIGKFIEYDGKVMDQIEFLEYKLGLNKDASL